MVNTRLSDAEVIASAVVCTSVNSSMPSLVQNFGSNLPLLRMLDDSFYVVFWPTGPAALLNGNPADQTNWDALLLRTYRQAEVGRIGPLAGDGNE